MRQTHTYVILPLSVAAYREIRAKLAAAGYSHAFHDVHTPEEVIDPGSSPGQAMHGIAVQRDKEEDDGDG